MAIPRRHPNFLKCGGVPCNSSPWPSRRRWSSAGPGCLFSRRQGELGCLELHLLHTDLPAHPQTTKAFLPRMLELQNGHIVCLNSVLALSAIPGAIDYCTSKASAFAFMESLTLGLLDCPGVSATTVLPFHTSTEMFQGLRVRSVSGSPPTHPTSHQLTGPGESFFRTERAKRKNKPEALYLWLCDLVPECPSARWWGC